MWVTGVFLFWFSIFSFSVFNLIFGARKVERSRSTGLDMVFVSDGVMVSLVIYPLRFLVYLNASFAICFGFLDTPSFPWCRFYF
jgi:hypothetical protein